MKYEHMNLLRKSYDSRSGYLFKQDAILLTREIGMRLRNIDTYHSFKRGLKELDLVGL